MAKKITLYALFAALAIFLWDALVSVPLLLLASRY